MQIKKMMGLILGGLSILGFSLVTGCDDDKDDNNGVNKLSQEQIKTCCGDDDGSDAFKACVADYEKSGVCAKSKNDDNVKTYYGPDPLTVCCDGAADYNKCVNDFNTAGKCVKDTPVVDENLKACCGDDDNSEKYKACAANYKNNNNSCKKDDDVSEGAKACCNKFDSDEDSFKSCVAQYNAANNCDFMMAYYGPAPVDIAESDIKDCCGDSSSADYANCADRFIDYCTDAVGAGSTTEDCVVEYKTANSCGSQDVDADLKACCGDDDNSEKYKACAANYKNNNNSCKKDDDVSEGAKACCHMFDSDEDSFKSCVAQYNAAGNCDFMMTYYGPAPVDIAESDIKDCCGDSSSADYANCANKFIDYCTDAVGAGSTTEDCVVEYKTANSCGSQDVDADLKACCGDEGDLNYDVCKAAYEEAGDCDSMMTYYGPDPNP